MIHKGTDWYEDIDIDGRDSNGNDVRRSAVNVPYVYDDTRCIESKPFTSEQIYVNEMQSLRLALEQKKEGLKRCICYKEEAEREYNNWCSKVKEIEKDIFEIDEWVKDLNRRFGIKE